MSIEPDDFYLSAVWRPAQPSFGWVGIDAWNPARQWLD